jgi:hypothetical protein
MVYAVIIMIKGKSYRLSYFVGITEGLTMDVNLKYGWTFRSPNHHNRTRIPVYTGILPLPPPFHIFYKYISADILLISVF